MIFINMLDYNLLNVKFSIKNYRSNNEPFFLQIDDISNNFNEKYENIEEYIETNLSILSKEIKDFYIFFKTLDQEIYINNWTFMSLSNIIEIYNKYKSKNINTIDIAFMYHGMGHIKILYYDPRINSINFRMDGGSNSYDREYNFKKLIEYNSNDPPQDISYNFEVLLNNIQYNVI